MKTIKTTKPILIRLLLVVCLTISLASMVSASSYAAGVTSCPTGYTKDASGKCIAVAYQPSAVYYCGSKPSVAMSIDIGCKQEGNPIMDATFAIIRFLSDGVGLVVIGSIIYGGIQYTTSRGDPQATATAVGRIRSSLFALLIFIFGYAILNYIIPAGFLK